jgi:NAD-dependent DNA ligase
MNQAYNARFADLLSRLSTVMNQMGEPMRAKAYKTAEDVILGHTEEIHSIKDLHGLPGIGPTIRAKLQEYLDTGKINVLEEQEKRPEVILSDVYGIGPKKAKELVSQGIKSIQQLRENLSLLNTVQKTGLTYYEDILKRIPRDEIILYDKHMKSILKHIHDPSTKYEIVGSYRREQPSSGDIDVIITSPNSRTYEDFLDKLIAKKIIIEVLSRGKHKCLVIAKIPESQYFRRVDFLYAPPNEYPFSVLYFTGSKGFNVVMRGYSLKQGYSLNEHGFTPVGSHSHITQLFQDEQSIFHFLGLQYIMPKNRTDGRAVIPLQQGSQILSQRNILDESVPAVKKSRKKREHKPSKETRTKNPVPIEIPEVDSQRTVSELVMSSPTEKKQEVLEPTILSDKKKKVREPKTKKNRKKDILPIEIPEVDSQRTVSELVMSSPTEKKQEVLEPTILSDKKKKVREPKEKKTKEPKKNKSQKNIKQSPVKISETMEKIIQEFKIRGLPVIEHLKKAELENLVEITTAAYFNETPLLTDNEYDIIKEYATNKYPQAEALCKIGAPISGKNKVHLPFEMPSMDKIKPDSGALQGWIAKYPGPYVLSCKLDGVSGLFTCSDKGEYKLYTRGDGCIGQDISHLIKVLALPQLTPGMTVRGEFILLKKIFADKYAAEFANARNLVSGIINRKTADEKSRDLHFVTYEVIEPHLKPSQQMMTLENEQLRVVQNKVVDILSNELLSDLLVEWRTKYDYEIDGVIVTNDAIHPRISGNPDYAFAFKMVLSDQVAEAKVVDVEWEASKNGYLKPRVRIEPIRLGGVTIEYATGFNGKFIKDNKIGIGAVIVMVRSGDVIPYIKSITIPAENPKMPLVPFIWNKTGVDVLLENPHEDTGVQEKNITLFFTTLEVDGIGKGNIHKLYESGKTTVPQILQMTVADFEKIEGFKKKTAEKLFHGIRDKIDNASLLILLVASGKMGRGLGERKIKPILDTYPNILTSPVSPEEKERMLKSISGIGPENAREFVKNIPATLEFLKECGLEGKLSSVSIEINTTVVSGPLAGKKIVMTKVRDKDIISFMTTQGATLEDSLRKDTMVLIVKSKDDKSNKTEYAEKHSIPIMTVEEFKEKYM